MLRFLEFAMLARIAKLLAKKDTKFIPLNDQPSIAGTTLINWNPNKLRYLPFVICLYKCRGVEYSWSSIWQIVFQVKQKM